MAKGNESKNTNKRNKLLFIWLSLAIPIINLLIFWIYVNIDSIFVAFERNTVNGRVYDLVNFQTIFAMLTNPNSTLPQAFMNTFKFFLWSFFVITPLCYIFAYFIYKKIFLHNFFRYIFFLPSIVSSVILTSFLKFMLAENGTIYNLFLTLFGEVPQFLADRDYAFKILLLYNLWTGFGAMMIYFYSAFARIPTDILEYGTLDGLTSFKEIIYIIFPLTWPTYSVFVVLGLGSIFSASGPVLLLTNGTANTYDLSFWSYITLTTNSSNGVNLVAAMGQLQTLIALPLAIIAKWLSNKIPAVEY